MSMLTSCSESPSPPLDGWRYADKSDREEDYLLDTVFEQLSHSGKLPYHFTADLNNDGLSDDAWVLVEGKTKTILETMGISRSLEFYKKNKKYGLFVFFNKKVGPPKIVEVKDFFGGTVPIKGYIKEFKPQKFEDEDREMEYSGIDLDYGQMRGGLGIYWDKKTSSFVEVAYDEH